MKKLSFESFRNNKIKSPLLLNIKGGYATGSGSQHVGNVYGNGDCTVVWDSDEAVDGVGITKYNNDRLVCDFAGYNQQ